MSERVDPFGSLDDFAPAATKPNTKHVEVAEQVAAENGFISRRPVKSAQPTIKEQLPSRRRSTGRSEQVNIKTTFAAKKRLMEISVEHDMPLGEVLEQALEALEQKWQEIPGGTM